MKYLSLLVLIVSMIPAAAQPCAPSSKEMAQFFSQLKWRQHSLTASGVPPVHGYLDENDGFYFDDLSRGGAIAAKVTVDPSNKSHKDFFKYCRAGKAAYLRSMRRSGEGNKYRVVLRYLPSLSDFANNPLVAQNYKESSAELRLKFEAGSSFDTLESYPDRIKMEVHRLLNKQLADQRELGLIELDLSGWDDVVCDLVQGRFNIWLTRAGLSNGPVVNQKKEVEPSDLRKTYSVLREQVPPSMVKEKAIFAAARAMAKLEQDRLIGGWVDGRGFDVLKKMMNPDMSAIANVDDGALSCLADQMQSYARPIIQHVINVQLKAPSLDEVEANSQERP